mgnify:CR=1 FL=1
MQGRKLREQQTWTSTSEQGSVAENNKASDDEDDNDNGKSTGLGGNESGSINQDRTDISLQQDESSYSDQGTGFDFQTFSNHPDHTYLADALDDLAYDETISCPNGFLSYLQSSSSPASLMPSTATTVASSVDLSLHNFVSTWSGTPPLSSTCITQPVGSKQDQEKPCIAFGDKKDTGNEATTTTITICGQPDQINIQIQPFEQQRGDRSGKSVQEHGVTGKEENRSGRQVTIHISTKP